MLLDDFCGVHAGETGWVLGSGATLNFVDPRFFDDKLCFTTNYVGEQFGLRKFYNFCHYHEASLEIARHAEAVFVPRKEHGCQQVWPYGDVPNIVLFDTDRGLPGVWFDPFADDNHKNGLIIGSSGLHGTMHLAAFMGCTSIVLVGADCGKLDGNDRFDGYPLGDTPWHIYNRHLIAMKQWLAKNYGCRVYSLNPFVNLNLEGHRFDGAN